MAAVEPVPLEWGGKTYPIEDEKLLQVLAKVEDVMGHQEVMAAMERRRIPMAKTAIAYRVALRALGVVVSDRDVYHAMLRTPSFMGEAFNAIASMYFRMAPPEHLRADPGKVDGGGPQGPAESSPSATGSSSAPSLNP